MNNSRQEKVWLNTKTNFFYIQRGIDRTPIGSQVEIMTCNSGFLTSLGALKGTVGYGLRNMSGQMIAYSKDEDDLLLFAIEHDWFIDSQAYRQLVTNESSH